MAPGEHRRVGPEQAALEKGSLCQELKDEQVTMRRVGVGSGGCGQHPRGTRLPSCKDAEVDGASPHEELDSG